MTKKHKKAIAKNFQHPEWTKTEDDKLISMRKEKKSVSEIATKLGRTSSGVANRITVLRKKGVIARKSKKETVVNIQVAPGLEFGAQVIEAVQRMEAKLDAMLAGKRPSSNGSIKYFPVHDKMKGLKKGEALTIPSTVTSPASTPGQLATAAYHYARSQGWKLKQMSVPGGIVVSRTA